MTGLHDLHGSWRDLFMSCGPVGCAVANGLLRKPEARGHRCSWKLWAVRAKKKKKKKMKNTNKSNAQ